MSKSLKELYAVPEWMRQFLPSFNNTGAMMSRSCCTTTAPACLPTPFATRLSFPRVPSSPC